jgi:hypothetical protein
MPKSWIKKLNDFKLRTRPHNINLKLNDFNILVMD